MRAMLVKRGYEDVELHIASKSALASEIADSMRSQEALQVAVGKANFRTSLPGEARVFFLCGEEKVTIRSIRAIQEQWPHSILIIVAPAGSTPFVKKEADVQVFQLSEVVNDVTTHVLVPTHTVVGDRDGAMVKLDLSHDANAGEKTVTVSKTALPQLPTSDAIARFLDLRPGEVVRIRRRSRGGGLPGAIFYRCVCAG